MNVEILLSDPIRSNINAKSRDGMAAIHYAAENGHLECVRLLIDAGVDVKTPGAGRKTALIEAAANGHFELVKYLVEEANAKVLPKDK